eukprot:XP_015572660.1 uncharacterized protein LOC107260970 [Ricinus communis]
MGLYNVSDPIRCKIFPTSLKESAQKWYESLLDGSIYDFAMLTKLFKAQFITSIPPKKRLSDLKKCIQRPDESLKDFVERFNRKAVQVEKLNQDTTIDVMIDNTCMNKFKDLLTIDLTESYAKLMDRAYNFIKMDEDYRLGRRTDYDNRSRGKSDQPKQGPGMTKERVTQGATVRKTLFI